MAVAMPHENRISQGYTKTATINRLVANFGDGYDQEALNGLNAIRDGYTLSWNNVDATITGEIETALLSAISSSLTWQGKSWRVESYGIQATVGTLATVTVQLKEIF